MDIIKEARKLVTVEIEKYGFPTKLHSEFSEKKALDLADKLSADKTIVNVGILLIDVKLGEAITSDKIKDHLKEHVHMSAKAVKQFLKKFDLDKESKDKIINCVEAHHGGVPFTCKEAEICANADSYFFLHPVGFTNALYNSGARNLGYEKTLNWLHRKLEQKWEMVSLSEVQQELEPYYRQFREIIKKAKES
ncbi:MAG: hypothetical protein ABIE94_06585 [archaeon]